ncbi:MAG: class I tRNA ligase family protein, partial [Spirochaetia bacterium]|nr:class I tRNA ligase family protein [Spirochaetia bacterium]
MPFITEEIHSYLDAFRQEKAPLAIVAPWPGKQKISAKAKPVIHALELLQQVIASARTIRAEARIAPDRKVPLIIRTDSKELGRVVQEKAKAMERLAQAESITVVAKHTPGKFDAVEPFAEGEVFLPLEGALDVAKETARLKADRQSAAATIEGIEKKLGNPGFVNNAPPEVVERERERVEEVRAQMAVIDAALKRMGG